VGGQGTGKKAGIDTGLAVDQTSVAHLVQEFRNALGIELSLEVVPDKGTATPGPTDSAGRTLRITPRPRPRRFVGAPTVESGPPPGMPRPPPRGGDETLRTGPPARMARAAPDAPAAEHGPPARMLPLLAGLPGAPQDWVPTVVGKRPRPRVQEPTTERYIPLPKTRGRARPGALQPAAESPAVTGWQVTATGLSLALLVLCTLFISSC
jgi:hypothetical protein